MGNVTDYVSASTDRDIIVIRKDYAPTGSYDGNLTVDELLDFVEKFMDNVTDGHDVHIEHCNSEMWMIESRLETLKEYNARIAVLRSLAFKEQAKHDRSWQKQKDRVKRAQKRREAKINKRTSMEEIS